MGVAATLPELSEWTLLSYFPNFHGQRSGGTRSLYFIPEAELFQPVADPDRFTRFLELSQNSQI